MGEVAQAAVELSWLVIWMVFVRKVARVRWVRRTAAFATTLLGLAAVIAVRTTVGFIRLGR